MRFEPSITIRETLHTFERFQKMTSKEFFDLYKKAMEVVDNHGRRYETPEMMFEKILRISNKKHPLPELMKSTKVRASRRPSRGSRSKERSKAEKSGASTFMTEVKTSKSKLDIQEPTKGSLSMMNGNKKL